MNATLEKSYAESIGNGRIVYDSILGSQEGSEPKALADIFEIMRNCLPQAEKNGAGMHIILFVKGQTVYEAMLGKHIGYESDDLPEVIETIRTHLDAAERDGRTIHIILSLV